MKVIAINGSPRKDGNTTHLLRAVLTELENEGIETELMHIGGRNIHGCTACMKCWENLDKKCIIDNDIINECIAKMAEADGIIIGSPTYFTDVNAEIKALIDRAGFVGLANGGLFTRKVGAAVVAVRRGGAIQAFDTINHLFGISNMITVGSSYWNIGIGLEPGEVEKDEEGMATMKNLGQNMAWLLKKIQTPD
ncbi:flavodoxin family protein [Methanogenium marinum]|uniref:Flavodoxin family protein n=1 Tax=Methanogenium marinum TaxID=348610 RepID=A0A9Q4PYM9_9EURY|nr:flavodoxin family protein [Methanogenium marinum]MDE4908262.1 flavodoxin family protein [Methanogenium marinum]